MTKTVSKNEGGQNENQGNVVRKVRAVRVIKRENK